MSDAAWMTQLVCLRMSRSYDVDFARSVIHRWAHQRLAGCTSDDWCLIQLFRGTESSRSEGPYRSRYKKHASAIFGWPLWQSTFEPFGQRCPLRPSFYYKIKQSRASSINNSAPELPFFSCEALFCAWRSKRRACCVFVCVFVCVIARVSVHTNLREHYLSKLTAFLVLGIYDLLFINPFIPLSLLTSIDGSRPSRYMLHFLRN